LSNLKKTVGIIFGGNSVEHEISILSVVQASYAIDTEKYNVIKIYMTKDGRFWVGPDFEDVKTFQKPDFRHYEVAFYSKNGQCMMKGISCFPRKYRKPIDVILPIVHGKNVEDGSLAGYFTILNVPYASSDVLQAAIFQNKYISKRLLKDDGLAVIPYFYFTAENYRENQEDVLHSCKQLGYPLILKPVSLGSSIGIRVADNDEELLKGICYGFRFEDYLLVERKQTHFREFNQAVLEVSEGFELSAIEEVKSSNAFLTFDDKYMPATSVRVIPAEIDDSLKSEIETCSLKISRLYHPRGVIRIDYLYDMVSEKLYVNEINTIPGSLGFYLFEEKMNFTELIDHLIEQAIRDKYYQDQKENSFKSNVLSSTHLLKK
jgi:D-alanine-D-alanine ligase